MRIRCLFLFSVLLLILSGCMFSPYTNPKFGVKAVDAWFSNKELGLIRKDIESIDAIVDTKCIYKESRSNKYIFKCDIEYQEKGETVIPLSKHNKKSFYVVFIKKSGNQFDSKVYNSSSPNKVWYNDDYLNY